MKSMDMAAENKIGEERQERIQKDLLSTLPKEQQAVMSHDWSRELHRFQHKDATCDYWIIGRSELILNKSCRQLNDFQLFQICIGGIQVHPIWGCMYL